MIKEAEKTKFKSPLINKKITISLIQRIQSSLHRDPDVATLATGGKKSFMCPPDKFGNLINPLTPEEQSYFESILGIDLNPNLDKSKNFYCTKNAMITLTKVGKKNSSADLELDLSRPYDYIKYKIARINPRVAQSWAERDRKSYEFVIIDGDVELQDAITYNDKEDTVNEYLLKNKTNKKNLYDLLRMYGIQFASKEVTYSNSVEWIYNELKKCTKRKSDIEKLYKLVSLGEKDIYSKIFIADCISMGLIDKRGPYEYRLSGGDKFASNEEDAIAWFEDKRNTSTKVKFEQIIEDYYLKHK